MIPSIPSALLPQATVEAAKSAAEVRLPLWGQLALSDPIFLVCLPLVVLAFVLGSPRWRQAPARVPVLPELSRRSVVQRLAWVPRLLQFAALVLVVLALARPLRGNVEIASTSEGVDIALLLDRSSSMDSRASRSSPTRFEIVKDVVGDFARRRMTDREGAADNVGLIAFALYPELLCPFTLDVDALEGVLEGLDTEKRRELDATGIGIALAKAVAVLRESDAKSRIVVLLTDGMENVEAIQPMDAARVAAEEGIRVYTVFAGPRYEVRSFFGQREQIPIDTRELEAIAETTGGRFYHAESREDLEEVYAEIESLERTEREHKRFAEHFDLYPELLGPALLCYLLYWLSVATWARRLP